MKISFIIPVYNTAPKMLNRCVHSILAITMCSKEILLIDDGSILHETEERLQELEKVNEISVYRKNNAGPSSARNIGLEKATGDFIMFVDSDDFVNSDYLNEIIENTKKDVDICFFTNSVVDEEGKIIRKGLNIRSILYANQISDLNSESKRFNIGVVWGKLFNAKILSNIRFNENLKYCEDALFLKEASLRVSKVMGICKPGYSYTINRNSLCHKYNENAANEFAESIKAMEDFFLKNAKNEINDFYYTVIFDYYLTNILRQDCFNKNNPKKFYRRYFEASQILKREPFAHILKAYVPQINNKKFKVIYRLLKTGFVYLPYRLLCYRFKKSNSI